jgi:hypothetical protein
MQRIIRTEFCWQGREVAVRRFEGTLPNGRPRSCAKVTFNERWAWREGAARAVHQAAFQAFEREPAALLRRRGL